MAGQYIPKTGIYAGQVFASYRQYLNKKAQDEGFSNFNQKSTIRKQERLNAQIRNKIDVSFDTSVSRGNVVIDVYTTDFLDAALQFITTLGDYRSVRIIVDVDILSPKYGLGVVRKFYTLVNKARVSLLKKEIQSGELEDSIESALNDFLSIHNVILWVYRS